MIPKSSADLDFEVGLTTDLDLMMAAVENRWTVASRLAC